MKRPYQHIIETTSRKAFENLLPDEWVVRPLNPDYGIDYIIEIFKDNKFTGKFFYVQVKGTSQNIINHQVKISMKSSVLQYYMSLPLPVLLVVYSVKTKEFWGVWINEYLKTCKIKNGQQTIKLKLTSSQLTDAVFIKNIEQNFSLEIYKKISITHQSNHIIGKSYHKILVQWLKYLYPNLLIFDNEHLPIKLSFNYLYSDGYLFIEPDYNLLGKYKLEKIFLNEQSDFLNYPAIDYNQIPDELQETLFFIATIFAKEDILTSLNLYKKLICNYSGKFKNPETLLNIGKISFEKNRIAEFQELVEQSINYKNCNDFQLLNAAYLFFKTTSLTITKDYYKENLLKILSTIKDNNIKGMLCYNLANSFRASSETRDAIKYYILAKKLEPDYLNRDYWWYEFAGCLFQAEHYKWAEKCYLKAQKLSRHFEPLMFALIGDCLFFQGRFTEALKWLNKYLKSTKESNSEFCLKHFIAKVLIDKKLENFKRNPQLAISLVDKAIKEQNESNVITTLKKAIKMDPLCGLAWFNYGISLNKMKQFRKSFIAFLTCCLIQDWDREAWLNALFLSFNLKEMEIFLHIFDTIKFKFQNSIFEDIKEFIKKQPDWTNEIKKNFFSNIHDLFKSYELHELTPDEIKITEDSIK